MKKKSVLAAIILIVAYCGCKKSNNGPAYYINASVDGATFYDSNCVAMASPTTLEIYEQTGPAGGGIYNDLSFEITSGYHDTGTYTFPDTSGAVTNAGAGIDSNGNVLIGNVGTVIITQASPRVVGTFSFTCVSGTKVKGSFSARIL
jgi:hypothetical protein